MLANINALRLRPNDSPAGRVSSMEIAIRWSHRSSPSDPRFLITDVKERTLKYCRVTGYQDGQLQWKEISRNSRLPVFRAFDWSYIHNVVAVGQWSGETVVLGLESGSSTLQLPVKSQRQCNGVAFNTQTLLATGLEKIRNDFCLNVYDINHWISDSSSKGPSVKQQAPEPVRKLASSEGITSIKFFPDQPNVLVVGVKGTCVRIYDLRDSSGNAALQYQTTCVHNIAVDPCDQNYFASASPLKDGAVHIWDQRSTIRPTPGTSGGPLTLDGPILRLKDVFQTTRNVEPVSIWSLRYSGAEAGCLGVLGNGGNFRIIKIKKDFQDPNLRTLSATEDGAADQYAERLYVNRTELVGQLRPQGRRGSKTAATEDEDKILAFDFMNMLSSDHRTCAITLRGNQNVGVHKLQSHPPVLAVSCRNEVLGTDFEISKRGPKSILPVESLRLYRAPKGAKIAESLADIYLRASNLIESKKASPTSTDKLDQLTTNDGWNDTPSLASKPQSTAEANALDSSKTVPKASIKDALLLADTARRRCLEGYLFNAKKNIDIVGDDENLQEMWHWISIAAENCADRKMITEDIDFSYLGVFNILRNQLGQMSETRIRSSTSYIHVGDTVKRLANSLKLPDVRLPKTTKPSHRRLCLHVAGFGGDAQNRLQRVKALALAGKSVEGALYALMLDDWELAVTALRSGPRHQQNRALGTVVSLFGEGEDTEMIRRQVRQLLGEDENIFVRAICAYMADLQWDQLVLSSDLPARYRVALAIKGFSDSELSIFVSDKTQNAVRKGEVSNILFTGLSGDAVLLFSNYIERTSDLQSVVLAISHAAPRFLRHNHIKHWRDAYRSQLNTWRLFMQRASFDLQSTKLSVTWDGTKTIQPVARQITLRCDNCDGPFHREQTFQSVSAPATPAAAAAAAAATKARPSSVLGGAKDGTNCPRCGAGLPRCVVCDNRVGMPDPHSRGGAESEKAKWKQSRDPFEDFVELCLSCKHIYHRGHAEAWFASQQECAAVGCRCRCNEVDGKGVGV